MSIDRAQWPDEKPFINFFRKTNTQQEKSNFHNFYIYNETSGALLL